VKLILLTATTYTVNAYSIKNIPYSIMNLDKHLRMFDIMTCTVSTNTVIIIINHIAPRMPYSPNRL